MNYNFGTIRRDVQTLTPRETENLAPLRTTEKKLCVRWQKTPRSQFIPLIIAGGIKLVQKNKLSGFILCSLILLQGPLQAAQSVTLAWNSCTNATSYNLYYGGATHVYTNKIAAGSNTVGTVTGLVKGRTYYFAATSINSSAMESTLSSEVSYTIPNPIIMALNPVRSNNVVVSTTVTANGGIPTRWGLQASTDLTTWVAIAHGTNVAVNVSVPLAGYPACYFRLVSE